MSETAKESNNDRDEKKPIIVRNSTDLQRLKLEKLMKNPEKPVLIPEKHKEKGIPTVPDFVRNVMGSSAGAGSGEFHVYRHLRRKEYARQKFMKEKAEKERLEDEYHHKLEENRKRADERTAKKRQKRLKKKQNQKVKSKKTKLDKSSSDEESDSESSEKESSDKESACNSTEHSEIEQKSDIPLENAEKECSVNIHSTAKSNETECENKTEEIEGSGNDVNVDEADKR